VSVRLITCALCGHRNPVSGQRGGGYITCSCGLQIDCAALQQNQLGWERYAVAGAVIAGLVLAVLLYLRG
jgi:hypothetical protein